MPNSDRYHWLAVTLHWVMAIAFLAMLASGLSMTGLALSKSFQFTLYQSHKSLGVILGLAFFLRLAVRLMHQPPALPQMLKQYEKIAAYVTHRAMYLCMIALPLSGWAIVSSTKSGLPTFIFGWFEWPHIPGIQGNKALYSLANESHELLAYGFIALITLHVAATLKHALKPQENLLPRMGIGSSRKKI